MKMLVGYILVNEEHKGSCRGCVFLKLKDYSCMHPSHKKGTDRIGCGKHRKIFKRDPNSFRTRLAGLINSMGVDNNCNIPDYVLADHMIQSMDSLCLASKEIEKHRTNCAPIINIAA